MIKNVLSVFIFFGFITTANAAISPSIPSPVSMGTSVSFSCNTGNTLSWFDSSDTFLDRSNCAGTLLSLPSDVYSFVECNSTVLLANCNGTSIVPLLANTGYVSDISYEWLPDPFSTMSDETQSVYSLTTYGLVNFTIFLVTIFGLIGIGIRGMRSIR